MLERAKICTTLRPSVAISLVGLLVGACSSDGSDDARTDQGTTATVETTDDGAVGTEPEVQPEDGSSETALIAERGHAETIEALVELLPADTRGAAVLDVGALLSGDSSAEISALMEGDGVDPALSELFGAVGALTGSIDVPATMASALVAQTTDATEGQFLVAGLRSGVIDEVVAGPAPTSAGTYGPDDRPVFEDANGNHLTILPSGLLIVGSPSVVESILDVVDGVAESDASTIEPFLDAMSRDADVSFVYGLPALFDGGVTPDRTLRGAAVLSGALDVTDGDIGGSIAFHTANAAEFVDDYNAYNRNATERDDPLESPLTLAAPIAQGLEQVVVTIPPSPLDPTYEEMIASRNTAKKLFAGMEALDEAEGVADRTEPAWLDFLVKSERDAEPSAGSVYIRWEFRDQAAIDAFEANELPAGFRLAPTRFVETDDPAGEYFLALNLYDAGGGSIVSGARAEWDVFVHPPEGADPNAGERPRFMVVEALAEEVSADAGNLLTPAEPLSHALVDGLVVSSVQRFDGDQVIPVFASTFPVPDPEVNEVARFTREMAIGNDYIYWAHGVSDRVLYNATTFNHDAYFVDTTQLTFTDDSPWARYLKPVVKDAVYYVNSLEYVASPMANLDSDFLDITPEWLAELVGFTTNGHQEGLMRKYVEQLFRGEADPLVGLTVTNETPSTYFNFEITDPDGMSAALDLPPGHNLAPIRLFEGGDEAYYLTLSISEVEGSMEGKRAEWSIYTDDGDGRPNLLVIDLMTADVGFDPATIINLPNDVRHELVDGAVSTHLSSTTIGFDATFDTAGATEEELSLDWIEAGDIVCSTNGICDKFYYDAETLDVPVHRPTEITMNEFSSPWNAFVDSTPNSVFYRDNSQEYVVKRWYNLAVPVAELPFSGLDQRTHEIAGSGTLIGRDSEIANSEYTYTGDVVVDGDQLRFALDQQVDNALGIGHIFTTGTFDLATGTGTQTVEDCQGSALLCSDIVNGSSAFYTAQALDRSDPDTITWRVDVVVDLGGSFGTADSSSRFVATRVD